MLNTSILIPPSPNWYGAHLLAAQPSIGQLAYAGHSSVVVADYTCCRVLRTMCASQSRVTAIAWAPDSLAPYQLVAGHEDGSVRAWDARSGACLRSQRKKAPEVSALLLLDRQPATALIGDVKGDLHTWAFQTAGKPQPLAGVNLRARVTQLALLAPPIGHGADAGTGAAPPRTLVAAACADGLVSIIDVDAGRVAYCFTAHRGTVHALAGGDAACTPLAMRNLGCVVLVTASGEEGTAKVWQVSAAGHTPSCALIATLPAGAGRNDGSGGRHGGRGRAQASQWLAACALPAVVGLHAAGPDAPSNVHSATRDAWVGLGLGTGEILIFRVNTEGGGTGDTVPYKLSHVHNRLIYGLLAVPVKDTVADALAAAQSDPGSADGETAASLEDPAQQPADGGGVVAPGRGIASARAPPGPGVLLLTISQDRLMCVAKLAFAMRLVSAKGAGAKGAKGGKKAAADPAPGTAPLTDLTDAAAAPAAAVSASGSGQPGPGKEEGGVAASAAPQFDLGALQVALAADGPGKGQQQQLMQGFRVAAGPPSDVTQRGFHGHSTRAGNTPGQPTALQQPPAAPPAADAVLAPAAPPPRPATPPPVVPPPIASLTPTTLAPNAAALEGSTAGALALQVASHQLVWKVHGMGGYVHCLDLHEAAVQAKHRATTPPAEDGNASASQHWDIIAGCGDRNLRTAAVTWPVTWHCATSEADTAPGTATAITRRLSCTVSQPCVTGTSALWRGPTDQITCVARHPFSPRLIAFGCQDGQVGVVDNRGQGAYIFPTRHQGPVLHLGWYHPAGGSKQAEAVHDMGGADAVAEAARVLAPPTPPPAPPGDAPAGPHSATASPGPRPRDGGAVDAAQLGVNKGEAAAAAAAAAAAEAAKMQQWQLFSCGAEGRLLAWQLPTPQEFATGGGLSGGAGLPGSGPSRGGADRSSRWGAAATAPSAVEHANDLMAGLAPLLAPLLAPAAAPAGTVPAPSGGGAPTVACMAIAALPTGDLLALALSSGLLVVLAGAAPTGGGLAPPLQGQLRQYGRSGRGGGQPPSSVAPVPCTWTVIWTGDAGGEAPVLIAANVPDPGEPLQLALASSAGLLTNITIRSAAIPSPASNPATSPHTADETVVVGQVPGGVTALSWLGGGAALAAASATDASVLVYGIAPPAAPTGPTSPSADGAPAQPALLATLRGHTDQVLGLAGRRTKPPHSVSQWMHAAGGPTDVTPSSQHLLWLVSASRDQSVRAWVLDLEGLWEAHSAALLQQQQQAAAALEAAADAAAAVEAAAGEAADGPPPASLPAVEAAGVGDAPAVTGEAGPRTPPESIAGGDARDGGPDAVAGPLVAAPMKSDITGVVGGRAKGARKAPNLAAKPVISGAVAAAPAGLDGTSQVTDQVLQDAQNALNELRTALLSPGREAGGVAAPPPHPDQQLQALKQLAARSADPVVMAAAGQLPGAPERQVLIHLWAGDVRSALLVAIDNQLLSADLVSVAASLGRGAWAAAARLYAAQQEASGQAHVAAMHLIAIGDRAAAAAVYRRAGLLHEAYAVDAVPALVTELAPPGPDGGV